MMIDSVSDQQFDALLDYLKTSRGFDFSGYKRLGLMRRVLKRMLTQNITEFTEYTDYLEVHPTEFAALFNTILINVTAFFRDPETWEYLEKQILPQLILHAGNEGTVRIWSAGCASGQEAYTLAIIMCEQLGEVEFLRRVKIYATDIDEEALQEARQAIYSASDVAKLPADYLARYFVQNGSRFAIRTEVRRAVIFGRHDLMQDAPISHMDLLVCRNTLMYLNSDTQAHILRRFHFGLKNSGYLFLGKAEMLVCHSTLFTQVDIRHRVFSKVSRSDFKNRLSIMTQPEFTEQQHYPGDRALLFHLAFESIVKAYLVVNQDGQLALANEQARTMLGILPSDIARPFHDLEISYRPVELRSLIDKARDEDHSVTQHRLPRMVGEELQYFDVEVSPLKLAGVYTGCSIVFENSSKFHRLYDDLGSAHEALEATNEELQSTNEELETTNEELQSTNEEIETTNEELHSANEELETISQELQSLMTEANDTNTFLQTILGSIHSAIIVLDRSAHVLVWNPRAEELWGMRSEEVQGEPFNSLDIGFPVHALDEIFRQGLQVDECIQKNVKAVNRRGRAIDCDVRISSLRSNEHPNGFVILIDENAS